MDDAALLSYCLAEPGARQDEPWEGDLVAKLAGAVPDNELYELVDLSYDAVVRKLPKSKRPT
ncbi:hypothetical protein ACRS5S_12785 [Nocardia asiatica]|uniref:hypothetical protein n=1 Tax=Nocardia asiatica TaxID=209252 RepID=UPI002458381F|nr:hypothetical protein [Nocardia asiatica]